MSNLDEWNKASAEKIDTNAIDGAIKNMRVARETYDDAKEISTEKYKVYQKAQSKVLDLLNRAKKTKYQVVGLGSVSVVNKMSVKTPKDPRDKRKLFAYIRKKGTDAYYTYLSINSATLNRIYNEEMEKNKANLAFKIPGIGAPIASQEIRFRKGK